MTKQTFTFKSAAALGVVALALTFSAAALAQRGPGPGYGTGTVVAVEPLTAEETQWLRFMREEEKLARDVYQQLSVKWNLTVFRNINTSEQAHFEAIGTLLTRYGAADPAQGTAGGVYTEARLNALYNELMAKGTKSAQDALEVGALIEKKDIADLESALKTTAKLDIKRVYTNLLSASFNHLEAFETICELTAIAR